MPSTPCTSHRPLAHSLAITAVVAAFAMAGTAMAAAPATAQDAPGPITAADYGQWERLGSGELSPDGAWMAVPISRVNEEDELRIRRVGSDSVVVIGYGSRATFSEDGRRVAYAIGMSDDEREAMRKRDERPESSLGILDLASGDTTLIPGVSSFDNLYLFPVDTDLNSLASTGFPMWDVKTALRRQIASERVVVVADACHSAGATDGRQNPQFTGLGDVPLAIAGTGAAAEAGPDVEP